MHPQEKTDGTESLHRVVIIGGGFAGVRAAQALKNAPVRVTLLDKRNYHLFQPLLYQVATGGLSPGEIAAPLRSIFAQQKNVEVLMSCVHGFNLEAREVLTTAGPVPYDSLIVAAGAKATYFGKDNWKSTAPPLKSIEDATLLRARIFEAFEEAEKTTDPEARRAWLTFLIVGGGPTGVELAGALGEIANDTLKHDFRSIRPEEARILILDAGSRILAGFSEKLSRSAEKQLIELGVRCRTNVRVREIRPDGLSMQTSEGEVTLPSRTVLWAAGVSGSPLAETLAKAANLPLAKGGRIAVEADCTVPGYPDVFVLGDLAYFDHEADGSHSGKPLAGVCQVAMQMGDYAGALIRARLSQGETRNQQPFRYFDKGNMAVIGRHRAIAQVGSFEFSGYFAWLLWVFIHVIYLVSFENRLVVAVRWAFAYFTFNRGARLITKPAVFRPPLRFDL